MSKFHLGWLLTACLFSTAMITPASNVMAQAGNSAPTANKIGLIDMAHLFKEYQRFVDERETLKNSIKSSDDQAKQMAEQIQALAAKLKSGTLKSDSPEFAAIEGEILKKQTSFEQFRKVAQRDFVRKESQIYKEVYIEVAEAVKKYAEYYNYAVILRFTREQVDAEDDVQSLMRDINRQVVYHNASYDITEDVLTFLNNRYRQSKGGASNSAAAPGGTTNR